MNTYVSFELAKLLKEKGFDKPTSKYFKYDGKECENKPLDWNEDVGFFSAPTISEVAMWLYEKHGVWVEVLETDLFNKFFYQMKRKDNTRLKNGDYNSPTEAYEAAIEYCLKNLI